MFNLLPEAEKIHILSEYKIRRGIVLFAFLFVVGLAALISIFPSYLFSAAKVRAAEQGIETLKRSAIFAEEASLNSDLSIAKVKLAALRPAENQSSIHSLIDAVAGARGQSIRINGFQFIRAGEQGTSTLSVSGVAESRASLDAFVGSLKKNPLWSTVDLPVSNFAKDKNNEFRMDLQGSF